MDRRRARGQAYRECDTRVRHLLSFILSSRRSHVLTSLLCQCRRLPRSSASFSQPRSSCRLTDNSDGCLQTAQLGFSHPRTYTPFRKMLGGDDPDEAAERDARHARQGASSPSPSSTTRPAPRHCLARTRQLTSSPTARSRRHGAAVSWTVRAVQLRSFRLNLGVRHLERVREKVIEREDTKDEVEGETVAWDEEGEEEEEEDGAALVVSQFASRVSRTVSPCACASVARPSTPQQPLVSLSPVRCRGSSPSDGGLVPPPPPAVASRPPAQSDQRAPLPDSSLAPSALLTASRARLAPSMEVRPVPRPPPQTPVSRRLAAPAFDLCSARATHIELARHPEPPVALERGEGDEVGRGGGARRTSPASDSPQPPGRPGRPAAHSRWLCTGSLRVHQPSERGGPGFRPVLRLSSSSPISSTDTRPSSHQSRLAAVPSTC